MVQLIMDSALGLMYFVISMENFEIGEKGQGLKFFEIA